MQQYEFCTVHMSACYLEWFTPNEIKRVAYHKDRARGDREDQDAIKRVIAQLGMEGWQLVNVSSDIYYFQRPLSSGK